MYVHASQIKAARAMLNWTREEFAAATGLSLNTIRNLEAGNMSARHTTNAVIRQVIEDNGLEFIDYEGIRRRPTDIFSYRGEHGCDEFYEDMVQTVKQRGGEVLVVCTSAEMLAQTCGVSEDNLERLEQLSAISSVKCLLSDIHRMPYTVPSIEFRAIPKHQASPTPYYLYGNKLGLVIQEGGNEYRFIIVQCTSHVNASRKNFSVLWDDAVPFMATHNHIAHKMPFVVTANDHGVSDAASAK